MTRVGRTLLGLAAICAVALALAPRAPAYVYWADKYDNTIGRARLDGGGVDQRFVTGLGAGSHPVGVAVDPRYVYWTNYELPDSIGRADIDGTHVDQGFVTGASDPVGLAVDAAHVYWTNSTAGTIGRAGLDGVAPDQSFVTGAGRPYGLAVDAAHVYWSDLDTGDIGRADLDGGHADPAFIPAGGTVTALAVTSSHLYWVDSASHAIDRAGLADKVVERGLVTDTLDPWGLAVGAGGLWWTNQGPPKTVGHAGADGGTPARELIPASPTGVYGVAVDGRELPPGPAARPAPTPSRPHTVFAAPARARAPWPAAVPRLRALRIAPGRFREGRGSRVTWRLDRPARVRLRVRRVRHGRGQWFHGAITRRGARGRNLMRFSGRVGRRRLGPGRYQLAARTPGGRWVTARFTIAPRR